MKKSLAFFCLTVFGLFLLNGCQTQDASSEQAPTEPTQEAVDTDALYAPTATVTITVQDLGDIELELYGNLAPISVENFISLAEDGFYDGLIFHRVIPGFMIQGGDPLGTGTGGADTKITGEFEANGIENPLSHTRGVLSMARAMSYDSASSQFFIMHADYPSLDGQYAAFGMVTSGMEVVDAIAAMDTNGNDKPLEDVVMESVVVTHLA